MPKEEKSSKEALFWGGFSWASISGGVRKSKANCTPRLWQTSLPLPVVLEIAHSNNVPVIVDAAAELPPVENLNKFTRMGADVVLFSGGKDIRGPQSSGLMLGKREIIDKCRIHGYPHHAIGRPMKMDKETIMGFMKAVELYLKEDHQKRMLYWEKTSKRVAEDLKTLANIKVSYGYPSQPLTQPASIPRVFIKFDSEELGLTKEDVAEKLYEGEPSIVAVVDRNALEINPHMLQEGEEEIIVKRIKEIVQTKAGVSS